mgnify:FL=1
MEDMKTAMTRRRFEERRAIPRLIECPELTPEIIERVTKIVFVPSNPQKADILFVFGSSYGDKWAEVVNLWKQELAPLIYIAGGIGTASFATGEILSHLIRKEFVALGVPPEVIIVDEMSTNSLEDAVFGRELFRKNGIVHNRILFACKAPHSGRCLRTLQKIFPESQLFPFIYSFEKDGETIKAEDWWKSEFGRSHVYGEYRRILLYSSRGDIV